MNINIEEFKSICKMSQKTLKHHLANTLSKVYPNVVVEDGYVFAQGKFPVLLVAHMDTVHKTSPKGFVYDEKQQTISSHQGIGGDDRCGIYMIMEVINRYNCSVLFCEDEEIGAVGASKFADSELIKDLQFNYIIEFDRKGSKDAVFYDCDNEDFEEFITKEFYKTDWGSFSDISVIAPALGCAAVNLSCGYYNAHTNKEYVVIKEMAESIEAACKILERTTEDDKFEYIEAARSYSWRNYGWYDDYFCESDDGYKETYFIIEYEDEKGDVQWQEVEAYNRAEAIGMFCVENPRIPYENVIGVCTM